MKKKTFLLLLFAMLIVSGCGNKYPVEISWKPPYEGSHVDHYIVEINNDGDWKTKKSSNTVLKAKFKYDNVYYTRVVAIGDEGQRGPYSPNSEIMFVQKP